MDTQHEGLTAVLSCVTSWLNSLGIRRETTTKEKVKATVRIEVTIEGETKSHVLHVATWK